MITRDQVLIAAKELPQAERNIKRVYTDETGRNCLAAAVLFKLGLGDRVPTHGTLYNTKPLCDVPGILSDFDGPARRLLVEMQDQADTLRPWGIAIDLALDAVDG